MTGTIFTLLFSAFFLLSCSEKSEEREAAAAPQVETYICKISEYCPELNTFGLISPVRKADILPSSDSIIRKMYFNEGDIVHKGDVLAELDMQQIDLQIQEAEASLQKLESALELSLRKLAESRRNAESRFYTIESAEVELNKKEAELNRMNNILCNKQKLHEMGGITKDELLSFELNFLEKESLYKQSVCSLEIKKIGYREQDLQDAGYPLSSDTYEMKMNYIDLNTGVFQAETDMAASELESAFSKLESLRLYRDENTISSPLNGIIVRRLMDEGEKASRDKPIYHICSFDQVFVSCRFSEKDLTALDLNQSAEISSPVIKDLKSGYIKRISPWIESDSGSGEVMILVDNQEGEFRFGQFVEVRIELQIPEKEILIPSESVLEGCAYILRDNHVFRIELSTGEPLNGMIPVYKGLREGDRIAAAPHKGFINGMEVSFP